MTDELEEEMENNKGNTDGSADETKSSAGSDEAASGTNQNKQEKPLFNGRTEKPDPSDEKESKDTVITQRPQEQKKANDTVIMQKPQEPRKTSPGTQPQTGAKRQQPQQQHYRPRPQQAQQGAGMQPSHAAAQQAYAANAAPRVPLASGGPPKHRHGRVYFLSFLIAILTSALCLFVAPLIFGTNPLDMLRGETGKVVETREIQVREGDSAVHDSHMTEITRELVPTVVNITVKGVQRSFFGSHEYESIGSGVIYKKDGFIITNNHVVQDADNIMVTLSSGEDIPAVVVGSDPQTDIAVIKIEKEGLKAASIGNIEDIQVGQKVLAIGSPEGFQHSVTLGIISGLHRNILNFHPPNAPNTTPLIGVIQTDAAINPGNSGGALATIDGKVIGINTAIYSRSGGYDGIGFAIPINNAVAVADQLIEKGSASHAWLGIGGDSVTVEIAETYNLPTERGVIVYSVYEDTAAQDAGIQKSDIIVGLNEDSIDSMEDLITKIWNMSVGDQVIVSLYREGELIEVEAVLKEKPSVIRQ